ncbi:MAG TPA: RIP metalloprotease RseP [Chitinophagaceae bacterium]|nr:RIP metalloprotease RseP [Chitinophagaceae bacterium]
MTTGVILIKLAQFLLALSILIILHEFGHFITAKLFKCRVEKFFLFFDPGFALVKKKIGETVYGIGWLPLGGYVKIAGMIDESLDTEALKQPPQPWEFRSKPAWQRLIIILSGVTVNILLAFAIFCMMLWKWGESYLPAKNLTYGIVADSLGRSIGLRDGDLIVNLDGKPVGNFSTIPADIILDQVREIGVVRNGRSVEVPVPSNFVSSLIRQKKADFIEPRIPVIVDSVPASSHFLSGRLMQGDRMESFNGVPVTYYNEFEHAKGSLKDTVVDIGVLRGGNQTVHIQVRLNAQGAVGFFAVAPERILRLDTRQYNFFQAIPVGIQKGIQTIGNYFQQLRLIFFSKQVKTSDSLGGFITIGNLFPAIWDWQTFWAMTAFLSIVLAIMNILPIPVLDGGHALFILVEMITRRKPSDKVLIYAQYVGLAIILALVIYANGLDVWRHWFRH